MEYNVDKKEIKLNRNLSKLDKFVLDFCHILNDYVIVSGYVSILFGRSRATEDVDLLIPKIKFKDFENLWIKINNFGFECINTSNVQEAFNFLDEFAIRFSRKNKPIPNMEFKIMKNDIDKYSFENKIKVILKQGELMISPLEMQIAYKLFLGSDKDFEDAKHIYELFKENLKLKELDDLCEQLKVKDKLKEIK